MEYPILELFYTTPNKVLICSFLLQVFPIKNSDEFQVARHETYYRSKRGKGYRFTQTQFPYHFSRSESIQYKDSGESKDHVIQEEIIEAYELKMLRKKVPVVKIEVKKSDKKEI